MSIARKNEININQSLINFFDNSIKKLNEILLKFPETYNEKTNINTDYQNEIKNNLVNYFNDEMSQLRINRRTHDTQIVDEVIYLTVCLFDDVLIHQKNQIAIFWKDQPLEEKLFGSSSGGHVIFDQIDTIIAQPQQKKQELIKLYYAALKIGFQGKYRQINFNNLRLKYTNRLSEIIEDFSKDNYQQTPPSFLTLESKYEKYLKKETIYLCIKFLLLITIGLLLIGDLCWFITNQFMLQIR